MRVKITKNYFDKSDGKEYKKGKEGNMKMDLAMDLIKRKVAEATDALFEFPEDKSKFKEEIDTYELPEDEKVYKDKKESKFKTK